MANEINANINVNLNSSQALASLKSLQSQISLFNKSVIQSNAQAVAAQKGLVSTLNAQIGATRQFSTSMTSVETSVSRLQGAIDKNKLSMGEYFRYGAASSKNFSKIFKRENQEITNLATDRVKRLQTQYLALGEAHGNMQKTMAVRPMQLHGADTAIAIQKQQIFNKLLKDGSTSLVNFGKNTQWAGRQLMVGFTIPLTIFGGTAAKVFRELEAEAINFKKVYGDIFTTDEETERALGAVQELSREFTKYGIAVKDTMALAGVAAQAGLRDADLMAATTQATRLATLGQMEQTESMRTIISMQTAFQQSNDELAESVDFLNIIENQTVLSLQDVAGAIPRVAPVIKGMGGDVKDLAILLVAMREGGVSAAEGANALKNSLARLVDPTSKAIKVSKEFGVNLEGIVEKNRGEVLPTIMELAKAMGELEGVDEQKLLATIFGKFQYARIGALFKNIRDDSSQASRAIELMGLSTEDLARVAEQELGVVEDSVSTKFTAAMEKAKLAIAPIGEQFLKLATPLLEGITRIFDKFNELGPTAKNFITILVAGLGVATPVILMMIGLFANFIGNALKGAALMNNFFSRIRYGSDAVTYLSGSQLDAAAAAASLEGRTTSLTSSLNVQASAVNNLARAYQSYVASARGAAAALPQGFVPPSGGGATARKMASGGMVPGSGNRDSEPALLTPGEFVINAKASKQFAPILKAINEGTFGKYNEGRIVSFAGQSFQAKSTSSAVAIEKVLSRLENITESQRSEIVAALQKLASENNLSRTSLESQVALPIKKLTQQIHKAHVFEQSQQSVSASTGRQIVSAGRSGPLPPGMEAMMSQIETMEARAKSMGVQSPARMLPRTDLVVELEAAINQGMRTAAGVGATPFKEAFERAGIDKWSLATKMAGVSAERAAPQFQILEERMVTLLEGAEEAGLAVGDRAGPGVLAFGDIVQQATGQLKASGQDVSLVEGIFSELQGRSKTLQVSLSATNEELEALGFTVQEITRTSRSGRAEMGRDVSIDGEPSVFWRNQGGRVGGLDSYKGARVYESDKLSQYISGAAASSTQIAATSVANAQQSKSPSRVAHRLGEEFGQGYAQGIESQTAQVKESSQALVTSGTSDIRQILKDRLGAGPLVEQELKNRRQQAIEEERINRAIQRRITLLTQGGRNPMAPGVAQRLAREQVLAEETAARNIPPVSPAGSSGGGRGIGGFTYQPGMFGDPGDKFGRGMAETSKSFVGMREGVKNFGKSLKQGSAKLTGASMALSGVTFALSTMEGGIGETAKKLTPFILGLSSIQMLLPLLLKLTNPVGLLVTAVGAAAIGLKIWTDRVNAARQKTADYLVAADGAISSLSSFAKQFGSVTPSQKLRQKMMGIKTPEEQERVSEMQQYLREGEGSQLLSRVSSLSGEERFQALRTELLQAVAFEVLSPEQAKDIAKAIGTELGSYTLGGKLVRSIVDAVGKDGKMIEGAFTQIVDDSVKKSIKISDTLFDAIEKSTKTLTSADLTFGLDQGNTLTDTQLAAKNFNDLGTSIGVSSDLLEDLATDINDTSNAFVQGYEASKASGDELAEIILNQKDVLQFIPGAVNNLLRLSEAQDLVNLRYREGLMEIKEYQELTAKIEEGRAKISSALSALLATTQGFEQFNSAFRQTLSALGKTPEEISAIETQARDAAQGIASMVEAIDAKDLEVGLKIGLAGEEVTKEEVASFYSSLSSDPDLQIAAEFMFKDASPEDTARLIKIFNELVLMPDALKETILAKFKVETDPPNYEEINRLLLDITRFSGFPSLQKKAIEFSSKHKGSKESQQVLSSMDEYLKSITSNSKISGEIDIKTISFDALEKANDLWNDLGKKKDITKSVEIQDMFSKVAENFEFTLAELNKLDDVYKQAILFEVTVVGNLNVEFGNLDLARSSADPSDRKFFTQAQIGVQSRINDALARINSIFDKGSKDIQTPAGKETSTGDTSGGSKEKSFLEQLLENIDANAKLYLNLENGLQGYLKNRGKFIGALKKLRDQGIPEEIISQIGTGPEGLKKAQELAKATKAERKKLTQGTRAMAVGTAISSLFERTSAGKQRVSAAKTISGESDEIKEFVMADEKLVAAFATVKKGSKAYKALIADMKESIKVKKEEAEITQTQEEAQISANEAVIKALELQMKTLELRAQQDFAAENGKTVDQVKEEIADREFLIKQYQRQIDEIERLNKKDQDRIDVLDRQKTLLDRQKDAISRQIEVLERANEMDQRRIEKIRREDEIRNRVADALNYELDLMSQQEEKINESYEKRFKALDKVAKINDHLINQQRKQLGLSQAIAEGDIYAATAAAQEMRASSAEFAREQLRSGMEDSRDRQIENLVTSGGLTRDQAEERIRLIKEQSYQTSLQIRDIEDAIYERTQLTIPLKDQIYNIDLQIRDIDDQILVINDSIYNRNLEIKAIQDSQIEPLIRQNEESQWLLEKLDDRIREESRQHRERINQLTQQNQFLSASVSGARDLREMTNQAIKKADDLSSSWRDVAKAARDAASAIGSTSVGAYAGGLMKYAMGGKVKKYPMGGLIPYAMGGVAGDGGRDSVNAMLTPGEFVIRKSMVSKYGIPMMEAINQGAYSTPRYSVSDNSPAQVSGGSNVANINAPVYNNYDMKFAVSGTNASADEIANKVMFKMKQVQAQGIRSNRGY